MNQIVSYNSTDYIWKSLLAEFLGTFVLVLVICLAVSLTPSALGFPKTSGESLAGALTYGLAFMALIYALGSYSGAHLNPAISFGFAVAGRMNWLLMLGYWVAQILGAIAAAGLAMYFVSGVPEANSSLGASIGYLTSANGGAAFLLEAFMTFILVLVVLFVTRNPFMSLMGGLAIGLVLTFEYLAAAPLTGASMNPARSLGPAIFSNQWSSYWIYLLGPLVGALLAALVYKLFATDWSCSDKKGSCGTALTNECGQKIKECKRPVLDKCGNPVKDCDGKVQMETYEYVSPKLTHHQENMAMAMGHWMTAQGLSPNYLEREFKVALQKSPAAAASGALQGAVSGLATGLTSNVGQAAATTVQGAVEGAQMATGTAPGTVSAPQQSSPLMGLSQTAQAPLQGAGTAVQGLGTGAGQSLQGLGQGLGQTVRGNVAGGLGTSLQGLGKGTAQGLQGVAQGAGQTLQGMGQGLMGTGQSLMGSNQGLMGSNQGLMGYNQSYQTPITQNA